MVEEKKINTVKLCRVCHNKCKEIYIAHPFFRHSDFTTVSKSSNVLKCTSCQTISNPVEVKNEFSAFKGKPYAEKPMTKQTIRADGYTKPVTRSVIQAKILTDNFISSENSKILDIGCFDGSLLFELDGVLEKAELWGFDINPHQESCFPKKDNFHFISTDLEDIEGLFQLIILSHSIIYIPDFNVLMKSINKLLASDGILFVQIPDISSNPCYSLMGDQSFIFTETSLENALKKFGYTSKVISNDYFPRELLIAAQKNKSMGLLNYEDDSLFERSIDELNKIKLQLQAIDHPNMTILGTTVNAAFIDEILDSKIQFFVDENPSIIGKNFREKKVLHPKDLGSEQLTILPYGKSNLSIRNRFQKLYDGTFTII